VHTQYDDIAGLSGLAAEEKKKIIIKAGVQTLKNPSYFVPFLLQIVVFICLLKWFPRGGVFIFVVIAYIFVTFALLKKQHNRLLRGHIADQLEAGTVA
jgi:hypothetical protein